MENDDDHANDNDDELYVRMANIFLELEPWELREKIYNKYTAIYHTEPYGFRRKGNALRAALLHFKLIAEPMSSMQATAAEYDEIMAAQEIMEGL